MDRLLEFTNNNPLLVTGTFLMALAVLFYELRQRGQSVFQVTATQAVRLINQGARVIDLRDKAAYDTGHIIDATNIPAAEIESGADKALKKNRAVILVCESGITSGKYVAPLRKAGFEQAFSLRGGLASWRAENLPVVGKS